MTPDPLTLAISSVVSMAVAGVPILIYLKPVKQHAQIEERGYWREEVPRLRDELQKFRQECEAATASLTADRDRLSGQFIELQARYTELHEQMAAEQAENVDLLSDRQLQKAANRELLRETRELEEQVTGLRALLDRVRRECPDCAVVSAIIAAESSVLEAH